MARSSTHMCMLVLTSAFLVCEIVLGQICRSLLIAVDSFHTLYVFIHLALSSLKHHPDPGSSGSPNVCASEDAIPPYDEQHFRRMRLKPFGILISALLLASQCVSISLEILTHLVQPEAIQHPFLSIVVGGVSLLFNILVLAWRRSKAMDEAVDGNKRLMQNDPLSTSESKEGVPKVDALMFCNPEASSVLDPDHDSQDSSSCPRSPNASVTKPVSESRHTQSSSDIGEGSQEIIQPTEKLPEEPRRSCTEPAVSQNIPNRSCFRRRKPGFISAVQDLLCSVLILTNGLVLLLSHAHCHRPHSDCHLLVYLDAVFSTACVIALLSVALPKLHRYGLLVLQATPLHLSVGQVQLCLSEVPGVLSVHELHVWQLSDALMVASLHVHCPDGMNAAECDYLMAKIKAVLATFGIHHCTVQPEFMASEETGAGSGRPDPVLSVCSLRCGQECVEKLCCSPQSPVCVHEEESCPPARVDEVKDVIIENTYL